MAEGIGIGVAINMPLSGMGDPGVSFFGTATIANHPFTIRGGNASGSWQISAELEGTIDLFESFDSLFGHDSSGLRLPSQLPRLTLSDLSLTFDTESGDYRAHGTTLATNFQLFGKPIKNASFSLDFASQSGTSNLALQSQITGPTFDTRIDITIAPESSFLHLLIDQYAFFVAYRITDSGRNVLALVRPGTNSFLKEIEIAWAKESWTSVPLRPDASYAAGITVQASLALANTALGRLLQIHEDVRIRLDSRELTFDFGAGQSAKSIRHLFKGASSPTVDTTTSVTIQSFSDASDEDELSDATNAQLTITGPVSFASVIDALSATTTDSASANTWREYLGECLELENLGFSLITDPQIGVLISGDATLRIGSAFGMNVRKAKIQIVPDGLPFSDLHASATLQSASIVANFPPVARASAALRFASDADAGTYALTGSGQLELFEKCSLGMLAHIEWQSNQLQGAFGFVFAKGLALGPPAFQLTGIGGGFGYDRICVLPTTAESVTTHPLLDLLKAAADGDAISDPAEMTKALRVFAKSLTPRPQGRCVAFAMTFRIAEWIECLALVVAEVRPKHFDLVLLGMVDFPIGFSSFLLGRIQLALLARWDSSDTSFRVLGTLANTSWLLHRDCKLQGGFAIALWPTGSLAGDFVLSLGGYSPLVPRKEHYPALDRVGFTWNVTSDLNIFGDVYFALDRFGLQFGARAGLTYTSQLLSVDAQFSFDVLATWFPLFFQTRARVAIQCEFRAIVTIRLGFIVDAQIHGPPFGVSIHLDIDVGVAKQTFILRAGSKLDNAQKFARPTPQEVSRFVKGNRSTVNQLQVVGHGVGDSGNFSTESADKNAATQVTRHRSYRADGLKISMTTIVPIQTVYRGKIADDARHPYEGAPIDIRPLGWKNVLSTAIWNVEGPTTAADWVCIPEMSLPLESLWYLPPNESPSLQASGRKSITSIQFTPPIGRYGNAELDSIPSDHLRETDVDVVHTIKSKHSTSIVPATQDENDSEQKRSRMLDCLRAGGFDLGDCSPSLPRSVATAPFTSHPPASPS